MIITLYDVIASPIGALIAIATVIGCISLSIHFHGKSQEKRLLQDKKYKLYHYCTNCHEQRICIIDMGTCLQDFLKDKKCSKCGCELKMEKK